MQQYNRGLLQYSLKSLTVSWGCFLSWINLVCCLFLTLYLKNNKLYNVHVCEIMCRSTKNFE